MDDELQTLIQRRQAEARAEIVGRQDGKPQASELRRRRGMYSQLLSMRLRGPLAAFANQWNSTLRNVGRLEVTLDSKDDLLRYELNYERLRGGGRCRHAQFIFRALETGKVAVTSAFDGIISSRETVPLDDLTPAAIQGELEAFLKAALAD